MVIGQARVACLVPFIWFTAVPFIWFTAVLRDL